MSAPFKDATNDAVQFLTKHGDLTRAAAYDAIRLLTGNGFVVTQTDMLPSATDLSQAAVAAALEAAAVIAETHHVYQAHVCAARIRAQITPAQHDALAAHVAAEVAKALADERDAANARADNARDAALVAAAAVAIARKGNGEATLDHPYDKGYLAACDSCAAAILAIIAIRDKPAPGLTPKIEVKFTWAKGDEEFWVHLKSPDGKSAGFNLGNPKGMIATALLRAIAGGGDE